MTECFSYVVHGIACATLNLCKPVLPVRLVRCATKLKLALCCWSASPYANNTNNAWIVNFNNGNDNTNNKNNNNYVRLVRGGES